MGKGLRPTGDAVGWGQCSECIWGGGLLCVCTGEGGVAPQIISEIAGGVECGQLLPLIQRGKGTVIGKEGVT